MTGSGSDYTATITPESGADGNVIIQVPANIAEDAAENGNTESQSHTVSVDLVRPTVVITGVPTTANAAFEVTITFGEDVTGFEADDISPTGSATATVTDLSGSGADYTAEITPTADGDLVIQVPADVAVDGAGNGNTASQSDPVTVDVSRPSVNIPNVPTTANAAFEVTITFTESVTGFAASDISLTGTATATVTDLSGSGADYTAEITPTADGDLVIQVLAGVAFDAAGNGNTASQSDPVTVDVSRPSVNIPNVPTAANAAFEVTITFTESVTGFAASDISLTGSATATVTDLSGSGAAYTAEITPTADGDLVIQVPADVAVDAAGNGNTESQSDPVTVDVSRPTVEITGAPTTANAAFEVTITFGEDEDEDVTGFEADDISFTGSATATVTDWSVSGAAYTAEITPTADGNLVIQVPADVAVDAAGNGNTASQSHTVTVDVSRPTVEITGVPTTVNAAFEVTITFTEDVTGFDSFTDDISFQSRQCGCSGHDFVGKPERIHCHVYTSSRRECYI